MLRLLAYAGTLTVVLVLSQFGGEARGQSAGTATSTPAATPAPTTTASIPSGQDLLTQSEAARTAKNTYHTSLKLTLESPGSLCEILSAKGDVSLKPLLEHLVATVKATRLDKQPPTTTTQRQVVILVKSKMATRTGKKAWNCGGAPNIAQIINGLTAGTTVQSADNLGADTVNGVAVWHVRVVESVDLGGQSPPITSDEYISQADFTPVRETASASITVVGTTINENVSQDYSKYGETVKIKLPAACKGKSSSPDLATQLAPALATPAALAARLEMQAKGLILYAHLRR